MNLLPGEIELNPRPEAPEGHRTATQVRAHALSLSEKMLNTLADIANGNIQATASMLGVQVNACKAVLDIAKLDVKDENPFKRRDGSSMDDAEIHAIMQAIIEEEMARKSGGLNHEQAQAWASAPGGYDGRQQ